MGRGVLKTPVDMTFVSQVTISNYRRKIRTLNPFFIDETQTTPPQGQDQVAELPSGKTQLGLWHDNDHCRRTWWKGLENIL